MKEAKWEACDDLQQMLRVGLLQRRRLGRKMRLFAVACCRRFQHLVADETCRRALELAERYAEGACTEREASNLWRQAWERPDCSLDNAITGTAARATASTIIPKSAYGAASNVAHELGVVTPAADDQAAYRALLRDIIGFLPFRGVVIDPSCLVWQDHLVVRIAQGIYDDRAFDRLPILADALEDAGCANADILAHCRGAGPQVRGCWVVDLILGKT